MIPGLFKRTALLLPLLGILLASLFSGSPASAESRIPGTARCIHYFESGEGQADAPAENADQFLHHARKFHCRPKALQPSWSLSADASANLRASRHTGRYVLRHASSYEDIPASSQYAYLFLLTPF